MNSGALEGIINSNIVLKNVQVEIYIHYSNGVHIKHSRGRCGRDRVVAGFTTTYAISIYYQ